jgi:hypothetical protein
MPRSYPGAIGGSISSGHVLGDNFEAQLDAFIVKTTAKAEKVIRLAILNMYGEIIETSPVDSGLFRANHQLGLGSAPSGTLIADEPEGKYPRGLIYNYKAENAQQKTKLDGYKLSTVAYICNNLKYSIPLEYGHSERQAPLGIYRKAALRFNSFLSTAAASVKG